MFINDILWLGQFTMLMRVLFIRFVIEVPLKRLTGVRGMKVNLRSGLYQAWILRLNWLTRSNLAYFIPPVNTDLCQEPHTETIFETSKYDPKGKAKVEFGICESKPRHSEQPFGFENTMNK